MSDVSGPHRLRSPVRVDLADGQRDDWLKLYANSEKDGDIVKPERGKEMKMVLVRWPLLTGSFKFLFVFFTMGKITIMSLIKGFEKPIITLFYILGFTFLTF